jgi:hypothetical protein
MFSVGNGQCLCLMACVHFSHCGSDQLWSNLLYAYYFPPLAFCVLILCTAPIFIYIIYTYIYIIYTFSIYIYIIYTFSIYIYYIYIYLAEVNGEKEFSGELSLK